MKSSLCLPALETTVRCRIAAYATLRAGAETIAQWRRQPVVVGAEKMPASFVKHSEDQTILGLRAVLQAIEQHKLTRSQAGPWERDFADWGVIAASNFFGRVSIAQTIQRYQQEGAWGISPHLIPHQSLHAMSGTISQALKIYGPNFGSGGGPNAGPDALLIAAAMMMDCRLGGLWVVLTGYESEWIPAADGRPRPAPMCQAVALALTPGEANGTGLHLSFGRNRPDAANRLFPSSSLGTRPNLGLAHSASFPSSSLGTPDLGLAHPSEFQLGLLAEELSTPTGLPNGRWRLADAHWLEIESVIDDPGRTDCQSVPPEGGHEA